MSTNGGPAFPTQYSNEADGPTVMPSEGMSLRDYFAGQALNGIEASQGNGGYFVTTPEKVARRAYEMADAMLAAREAK